MTKGPMTEGRARMFETVLVANRGEIACRIIATLQRMGIRSIAVYSDADRDAKHVLLADEAVRIGPAEAAHSYLDAEAIVAAARACGAQAVHPGYGFLSENAGLARACAGSGLVFIGPGERALEIMGDKIRAKRHVVDHGVATTPGIAEPGLDDAALAAAAAQIGFPVLIKPSAGGGGKGMYAVREASELGGALSAARRIAGAAFGDDTLFIERLVERPRHIEVQVLADAHGNTIHLGERECSLQRRHQKVIEEAPSPLVDEALRARLGEAACRVARSVDYLGAGTVEFLVSDSAPDEFFFMEMNTRLQVEHPVTEQVTGVDLVEWQIRVAAGEPLTIRQPDVRIVGHAIEARVYAEDPRSDFLPQTGRVLALREARGEGIRVDSALMQGLEITPDYDPMVAKVVGWGEDRGQALSRLRAALAETVVLGVHTNIEYLEALLDEPAVRAGELDTGLIERTLPGIRWRTVGDVAVLAAAAWLHADFFARAGDGLWAVPDGWRLGAAQPTRYSFAVQNAAVGDGPVWNAPEQKSAADQGAAGLSVPSAVPGGHLVDVDLVGGPAALDARIAWPGGETARLSASVERAPGPGGEGAHSVSGAERVALSVGGRSDLWEAVREGDRLWLAGDGAIFELRVRDRSARVAERLAARIAEDTPADPEVRTPMPGTVVAVAVVDGDSVEAGQTLLTIEAMKMEHRLLAPVAGEVRVLVGERDLVKAGQLVASVTPT